MAAFYRWLTSCNVSCASFPNQTQEELDVPVFLHPLRSHISRAGQQLRVIQRIPALRSLSTQMASLAHGQADASDVVQVMHLTTEISSQILNYVG